MRKLDINGGLSYKQYKFVDLFLFMVIMAVFEAINVLALKQWFDAMYFSVSLMFTVSLIVLVRWNFWGALFPPAHGIIFCALMCVFENVRFQSFVIYAVGNSFIILAWFIFKVIPKEKLFSKWYLTLIYPLVAFILVILGRTLVAVCFGENFVDMLGQSVFTESINITFAVIALLILRRIDGMLCDQKQYLLRIARDKAEAKTQKEDVWRGYTELDEEELKKLTGSQPKKDGKAEEEGDGVSMWDEYPPESR